MQVVENKDFTGMKKAVGYLRRSTDRQTQSIPDQRKAIERYASEEGFEVLGWYLDDAVSGTSTEGRREFLRLIDDAQKQNGSGFRYVLTYDVKRFGRVDNDEAGYYRHLLRKANVEVIYTSEGFRGDDSDEIIRSMKQWQARQETKDLSKVTIRGHVSLGEQGHWNGGCPPYGYDLLYHDSNGTPLRRIRWTESGDKEIYSPDGKLERVLPRGERFASSQKDRGRLVRSLPERVKIIRRIFSLYVEKGMGFKSIAAVLNSEEIPTPRNGNWKKRTSKGWTIGTIREILVNPAFSGDLAYNRRTDGKFHRISKGRAVERSRYHRNRMADNPESDWIVVPNCHEALVPKDLWRKAQAIREARKQKGANTGFRRGRGLVSPYLLSGLVECGGCGHKFHGHKITKGKAKKNSEKVVTNYYICGGYMMAGNSICRRDLIRREALDDFIIDRVRLKLVPFLENGGDMLFRSLLQDELNSTQPDPKAEMRKIRKRLQEISEKADVLLENLTPANRDFLDEKLAKLKRERRHLEEMLEEQEKIRYEPVDMDAIVSDALGSLGRFQKIMDQGSLEEKKSFLRVFVGRIKILPGKGRGTVEYYKIPDLERLLAGNSSFKLVAGVRLEALQKKILAHPEPFAMGRRGCLLLAA